MQYLRKGKNNYTYIIIKRGEIKRREKFKQSKNTHTIGKKAKHVSISINTHLSNITLLISLRGKAEENENRRNLKEKLFKLLIN